MEKSKNVALLFPCLVGLFLLLVAFFLLCSSIGFSYECHCTRTFKTSDSRLPSMYINRGMCYISWLALAL